MLHVHYSLVLFGKGTEMAQKSPRQNRESVCHCKQDGDGGLLVHIYFILSLQSYVYYLVRTRKRWKNHK